MALYRRFAIYFYQYQENRKGAFAGFGMIELRDGSVRMQITGRGSYQNAHMEVYGLLDAPEEMTGIRLGTMRSGRFSYEGTLQIHPEYSFSAVRGIVLCCRPGGEQVAAAVWSGMFVPERFCEWMPRPVQAPKSEAELSVPLPEDVLPNQRQEAGGENGASTSLLDASLSQEVWETGEAHRCQPDGYELGCEQKASEPEGLSISLPDASLPQEASGAEEEKGVLEIAQLVLYEEENAVEAAGNTWDVSGSKRKAAAEREDQTEIRQETQSHDGEYNQQEEMEAEQPYYGRPETGDGDKQEKGEAEQPYYNQPETGDGDKQEKGEAEQPYYNQSETGATIVTPLEDKTEAIRMDVIWEQMEQQFPKMLLQMDGMPGTALRIRPCDIRSLPENDWADRCGAFVARQYTQYRCMILGRQQTKEGWRYFLGMPGTHSASETKDAETVGFTEFVPAHCPIHPRIAGFWIYDL